MTQHRARGAGFTATAFLLATSWAAADHTVKVTAGKKPLQNDPVTATLPQELAGKQIRLFDAASGNVIAAQVDQLGGKPALTWQVDELPAGESKTYSVEVTGAQSTADQRSIKLVKTETGLDVTIDGELFTTYVTNGEFKPYCWPIIGPTGKPVTRDYPMKNGVPGEAIDHHHHRSFWFTHGTVNGQNFWSEDAKSNSTASKQGKTLHRDFAALTSGPVFGEFSSKVDWIASGGDKVCEDVRRHRIYRSADARIIDFEIRVKAGATNVVFGDDKEGTFGVRMAGSLTVDQGKGKPKSATLVNSNGQIDGAAWGKRATWCDYFGPLDGETVGIAIFDHPTNFCHPTYWHARTYGLYCANPFGIRHFTGDKQQDGSYIIAPGKEMRLQYRVLIHKGDATTAKIADRFAAYAAGPTVVWGN